MNVVLISHGEIGSGALTAHLLGLARRLSPHERVHHVALAGPRLFCSAFGRRALERHRKAAGALVSGGLRILPHGPRGLARPLVARALAAALRRLVGAGPAVLHARGYLAALAAAEARDLEGCSWSVLHDVRADRSAEVACHGGELPKDLVELLEREACSRSEACTAVSAPLARLVERRGARGSVPVFACAADTELFKPDPAARLRRRSELGVGEDGFVLGFLGSAAPWQQPEALARLFRLLLARRPGAHLLVLSPSVAELAPLLERELPPTAPRTFLTLPHGSVPEWLAACDATALLRERDALNAVASPIKFGESLACGVPVLLTEGIGDASASTEGERLGAVFSGPLLSGPGDEEVLDRFLAEDAGRRSQRCRRFAEERWSWAEQIPRWLALHASLAGQRDVGDSSRRRLR